MYVCVCAREHVHVCVKNQILEIGKNVPISFYSLQILVNFTYLTKYLQLAF